MLHLHRPALSRRSFCLCCIGSAGLAAAGTWLTPAEAYAEARGIVEGIRSAAAAAPIKIQALHSGISVLQGSGGNIAVLTGSEGKLLVDAGISVSRPRLAEALADLGPEPVRHLINTHWHFDHADGNAWLGGEGAIIRAHERTRDRLATLTRVEDWQFDFPPSPLAALPTELISTDQAIRFNEMTLVLQYYGPAHTDGDISVTFEDADIVHTGDLYWSAGYPFIDYSTGGSIGGTIQAIEAMLAVMADSTIVIPGHGPISDRAGLAEYRAMLVAVRDSVAGLKRQGRTLAETVAAKPTAAFDARWGEFVIDPAFFTRLVYAGA